MSTKMNIQEAINAEAITVQDCIDKYEKKGEVTVLSNGAVIDFVAE